MFAFSAAKKAVLDLVGLADSAPESKAPRLEIAYWAIKGLAAPLRMMAEYTGNDADFVMYEVTPTEGGGWNRAVWMDGAKPAIKAINSLANLPYVKTECGRVITQSNACMSYLGRRFKLMGANDLQLSEVEQCMCQVTDLRNSAVSVFYGNGDDAEVAKAHLTGTVKTHYSKFDGWFAQRSSTFLVADTPLAADFHLWEMIDQHEHYAKALQQPSGVAEFPRLATFYADFAALPELQAYFNGPYNKLPENNRMAKWGAGGVVNGKPV